MDISVVIPVYNSGHLIRGTLQRLEPALRPWAGQYEILICDDASPDASAAVLRALPSEFSAVTCFFHPQNRGLGGALRTLFAQARGEIVIYLDCDLPFGTDVLSQLISRTKHSDLVIASRYLTPQATVFGIRKFASRGYYYLCRCLFGITVKDIGSGTVAIRRSALLRLDLKTSGFDIHVEWLIKARQLGLMIEEIPAVYQDAGRGSFQLLKHGPVVIADTLRLWFN